MLILTTFDDADLIRSHFEAGASGFLLKDVSAVELREAIRQVMRGGTVVDPRVAGALVAPTRSDGTPVLTETCQNCWRKG